MSAWTALLLATVAYTQLFNVLGTSVMPDFPQLPVIVDPGENEFQFVTACSVPNCFQCSFDSSAECARCQAGFFAFKYSYDVPSTAPLCLDCSSLGCDVETCTDQLGCSSCPNGSVLTTDFEAKSSPKGSVVYYSLPTKCQQCEEDLLCSECKDRVGCTSCPPNHFKFMQPSASNYTRCVDCSELGCSSCEDGVGCTACPPGDFLFSDGDYADGLVRCMSCADLNCDGGWCVDNQGCSSCPEGFVLSQELSDFPFPPVRCLDCNADLNCEECDGQSGCLSCPPASFLRAVKDGDMYPRTECASCDALNCASCEEDVGCLTCPQGFFLDTSSEPHTCVRCSSALNCGACNDEGCEVCPPGSYLMDSLVYPGKQECARCPGCLSCSEDAGCEACMLGFFRTTTPSTIPLENGEPYEVGSCLSCTSNQCAGCQDGVGCTSCMEGTYLFDDTDSGYMTCKSCAEDLNCDVCGDTGCRTCPFGHYRCRKTLATSNQTVTGCCPCTGCAKCEDFKGCTACPYNYTLTELPEVDPFNTCQGDCTAYSCQPCDSEEEDLEGSFNDRFQNDFISLRDTDPRAGQQPDGGASAPEPAAPAAAPADAPSAGAAPERNSSRVALATRPRECNSCPRGQFVADPEAPFLDCRDCSAWLGCTSCTNTGCTSCPAGFYLAKGASDFGASVTSCSPCSGCLLDACADNFGCVSCPGNFSMSYGEVPFRRCYECGPEGLGCASCSNDRGCTSCPAGFFLDRPSINSPWYCSPCQLALGCSECSEATGCTVCPEGFILARLGAHWSDVTSCVPILGAS